MTSDTSETSYTMVDAPSPNHEPRRPGTTIDILILHYTGMKSAEAALTRLRDPASRVSAHYQVDEDGTVHRLVSEDRRAWHAGVGYWAGDRDINTRSVGIEIVNPGHEHGYRYFPEPQMVAVEGLCLDILSRHPIPPHRVIAHSDMAPDRKEDPGELFDWPRLARKGIGLWPGPAEPGPATPAAVQDLFHRYGYEVDRTGQPGEPRPSVVRAFQRHFRPQALTGEVDNDTLARLASLVKQAGL